MKKLAVIVVAAALLLLIGCSKEKVKRQYATFSRGDEIIAALEKYKDANSKYPDHLTDLTPQYLIAIPPPVMGNQQWKYETSDNGQKWKLTVEGPSSSDQKYWRSPELKIWTTDRR